MPSTFEDMKRDIETGWDNVLWSESYGWGDMAALAACITFGCAQAYLGQRLKDLAAKVGTDVLEQVLADKGKALFGPGDLQIQAGDAYWSVYHTLWNILEDRQEKLTTERYVRLFVRYRRQGSPPTPSEYTIPIPAHDMTGELSFYQDLARNGTVNWANQGHGVSIGTGWQDFKFVFGGQDGIIYAVSQDGGLEFYQDLARNGTPNWAHAGRGQRIGSGWQNYKFVFGGQDGIIYAVSQDGGLEFFQDLARNGTSQWAHAGRGQRIGGGWQSFKSVFGGQDGIIYTVSQDGGLDFYRDLARNGTVNWAHAGQGKRIGSGWQNFKSVFGGDDGIIYAISQAGGLDFFRDLARNGTVNWAHAGQGKRIGSGGWQNFKSVFGGDDGIIYAVYG